MPCVVYNSQLRLYYLGEEINLRYRCCIIVCLHRFAGIAMSAYRPTAILMDGLRLVINMRINPSTLSACAHLSSSCLYSGLNYFRNRHIIFIVDIITPPKSQFCLTAYRLYAVQPVLHELNKKA